MNANVGRTDRTIRVVAAIVAVVLALATGLGSVLGIVLLLVGVVLGVTAAVGFCPLYRVLGMNTCPAPKR